MPQSKGKQGRGRGTGKAGGSRKVSRPKHVGRGLTGKVTCGPWRCLGNHLHRDPGVQAPLTPRASGEELTQRRGGEEVREVMWGPFKGRWLSLRVGAGGGRTLCDLGFSGDPPPN